jgi:hypothetical protein
VRELAVEEMKATSELYGGPEGKPIGKKPGQE